MKRRTFLELTGATTSFAVLGGGGLLSALTGCGGELDEPVPDNPGVPPNQPLFAGGITTSLPGAQDYVATVQGRLPAGLAGSVLYKNGPGLFERDGFRKRTLVDGDGAVNAYMFEADGTVRFKYRFVQTPKYALEAEVGRYLYPTWTTPAPGALGPDEAANSSQAGVSVWNVFGKLLAFDESNFPEALDPDTLETLGTDVLGVNPEDTVFAAHPKLVAETGETVMFGVDYRSQSLVLTVFDPSGAVVEQQRHVTEPVRYVHDFFATAQHMVLAVHPAVVDFPTFFSGETLRDSLRWDAGLGMRWLVFERGSTNPPVEIEAPARWMWHSANMYARGDELVCDWIGYDDPGHFIGAGAEWERLMEGSLRQVGARGRLRRTVLDPRRGRVSSEEVLSQSASYEFPQIPYAEWGRAHRKIWSAAEPRDGVLWSAVKSVDVRSGAEDMHDFGPGHVVTEPNLATGTDGRLYALVEVGRAATGRASLAILDAHRLQDGPVAEVRLRHHLPVRFHGHWVQR